MDKHDYMKLALAKAEEAFKSGEIPVGAVIVKDGEVISSSHNTNRLERNPLKHAEMTAIETASRHFMNERLDGCDLYVTKEPCAMCAGAIIHSRLRKVIIGAKDIKYGACGTVLSVLGNSRLNHVPEIEFGVMEDDASQILKMFFKDKRGRDPGHKNKSHENIPCDR